MRVRIQRLDPDAFLPEYAHGPDEDAGMDLRALEDALLEPGEALTVRTGIAIELPAGYEAQVRPRSGLAAKSGVTVLNSPGTIDSDYRGEVKVILINHGAAAFTVTPGMRIAQMVVARVAHVTWEQTAELPETDRGAGGFGSSGR